MKIYKITEASKYLGISINSLKTLANNGKLNSFKTGAKKRQIEFCLTMDMFKKYWQANCCYCGTPLSLVAFQDAFHTVRGF